MLRITGGEFRGRFIEAPAGSTTRPTQSRLRQALFNSIQMSVPDARVLDLFAGSGALGFEALSRGAERVVFVEQSRVVAQLIERNARDLGVIERIEILSESVDRVWKRLEAVPPFGVVLADPPYAEGWEERLLSETPWERTLAPQGLFVLEWGIKKAQIPSLPDRAGRLVKVREKNYGDSVLTHYEMACIISA
jgi:16S rRNA (guanine966-N2)-methyltransferase